MIDFIIEVLAQQLIDLPKDQSPREPREPREIDTWVRWPDHSVFTDTDESAARERMIELSKFRPEFQFRLLKRTYEVIAQTKTKEKR